MPLSNVIFSAYDTAIPAIIYGTAWKKDQTAALVKQAIDCGFRGIDTACQPRHYHEPGVGEALSLAFREGLNRDDFYLQTKFTPEDGQDPANIPYDPTADLNTQVAQSFAVSLRNLRTDYLDALILHSPLTNTENLLKVWRSMEAIFNRGGTRLLGISNCYQLEQLQFLYTHADIKPALLQNRFYRDTHYDVELRRFCTEQKVIYQSFWTLTANPGILNAPVLQKLANSLNRTAAQIFFRYLNQKGIIPLTGTTNLKHMQEDLAIFEFNLAEEQTELIDVLLK